MRLLPSICGGLAANSGGTDLLGLARKGLDKIVSMWYTLIRIKYTRMVRSQIVNVETVVSAATARDRL